MSKDRARTMTFAEFEGCQLYEVSWFNGTETVTEKFDSYYDALDQYTHLRKRGKQASMKANILPIKVKKSNMTQTCEGCKKEIDYDEEFRCAECGKCPICGTNPDNECKCHMFDHDW